MSTGSPPPFDLWHWTQAWADTWMAGTDPSGIGPRLRERRLAALIETAVRDAPFYRRHATRATALADFEPVTKPQLMAAFDDWATDRRITRSAAEAHIADPSRVADAWLGRYLLWTSSGTSGHPGLFVQDAASLAAYDAIDALRLRGGAIQPPLGVWGIGQTFAFVGATGGHFAGLVSLERLRRLVPAPFAPALHLVPVQEPLERIAARLQAIGPDVLITYPSGAAALAAMQDAGALRLALTEVWLGGEQLSAAQRRAIAGAFGCTVRNAYGASEFYSMAFECAHGQLHLNDDWLVLEALDAHGRPVAPGEPSTITLLTNLANRTQPLIRYRLDDRIRLMPQPCACGNRFPVVEVAGRCDDALRLCGRDGHAVVILPLALETAIEEAAGVTRFQVLQCAEAAIELRLEAEVPDREAALRACCSAAAAFLAAQGLAGIRVRASRRPPLRHAASGKVRRVVDASTRGRRRAGA